LGLHAPGERPRPKEKVPETKIAPGVKKSDDPESSNWTMWAALVLIFAFLFIFLGILNWLY
jgi:hypothetical protein